MPKRIRINRKPSPLPVWMVEKTSTRGVVKVTCPRRDCKGVMWVRRLDWLRASNYMTRPCTFCWKASQLPEP